MHLHTVKKMARDAGFREAGNDEWSGYSETLRAFAALAYAAGVREGMERAAGVCDRHDAVYLAAAIRAAIDP